MKNILLILIGLLLYACPAAHAQYRDLSTAYAYKDSVTELQLGSNARMNAQAWRQIAEMTQLETLTLQTPHLRLIPDFISELQSLRELNITQGSIDSWNPALTELQNLTSLTLSDCSSGEIPDFVYHLPNLKHLSLAFRDATSVQSLEKLTQLESLELRVPNAQAVFGLSALKNLQSLTIVSEQMPEVPLGIFDNPTLRRLQLQLPAADYLPDLFNYVRQVDTLIVHLGQLSDFPKSLRKLKNLHLFELRLSGDALTQIDLEALENTHTLVFQGIEMGEWISPKSKLKDLKEVRFYSCGLNEHSLDFLKFADLTYLGLHRCHGSNYDFLGNRLSAQSIIIQDDELQALPQHIHKVKNLQHLDISSKKLSDLARIEKMSGLQYLSIGRNYALLVFPKALTQLTSLRELHIDARNMKTVPSDIGQLVYLRKLTLKSDNWKSLPADFDRLIALRFLTIGQVTDPDLISDNWNRAASLGYIAFYVPQNFSEGSMEALRNKFPGKHVVIKKSFR